MPLRHNISTSLAISTFPSFVLSDDFVLAGIGHIDYVTFGRIVVTGLTNFGFGFTHDNQFHIIKIITPILFAIILACANCATALLIACCIAPFPPHLLRGSTV